MLTKTPYILAKVRLCCWALSALLIGTLTVEAKTTIEVGADASKYVLKGTLVTPHQVFEGEVVVEQDTITCVEVDCVNPVGAWVFTITDAYIYPGFIDAHNHVAYNFLPKWTPPKLYENRGQWQRAKSYKEFKAPYSQLKDQKKLICEMVKYGEIRALLSGVTTIQGTSPDQICFRTLIRNAENQSELNVSGPHIRTSILDIKSFKGSIDPAVTKSFVVHLAEGIDEKSRAEFITLKQKQLLTAQTAIIHGTAFTEAEFAEMGGVGAKLIWSPQSNLALYGQTTDIRLALQHNVSISLGVDWNPSGSDHLFDELRVAEQQNITRFGGAIKEGDWIKMITINPAGALAIEEHVGQLAVGLKADITVLKAQDDNAHRSLLKNHPSDVEMVWVGGELLYGDQTIVNAVKPGECEALLVGGAEKQICVTDTKDAVPKSTQTLQQIKNLLLSEYSQLAPLAP